MRVLSLHNSMMQQWIPGALRGLKKCYSTDLCAADLWAVALSVDETARIRASWLSARDPQVVRCFWLYRGADKSLARPDLKKNWKVAIFRPTRRSLLPRRPGWTDNLLNCFWVKVLVISATYFILWEGIFLVRLTKSLVAVACFLPGRAKDLSAPRYNVVFAGDWRRFYICPPYFFQTGKKHRRKRTLHANGVVRKAICV